MLSVRHNVLLFLNRKVSITGISSDENRKTPNRFTFFKVSTIRGSVHSVWKIGFFHVENCLAYVLRVLLVGRQKERTIDVSKELMALYTDYLVHEYGEDLDHDYIFINLKDSYFGHPLKYQSVLDLIRRLGKWTGITFTAHI